MNSVPDWIATLIDWADQYGIPDLQYSEPYFEEDGSLIESGYWFGLPREKELLLKLEELNLNGYLKSDIPDEIRFLRGLKKLSISDGPSARWDVEDIDRDEDCITEIPPWISELTELEFLDLSYNNISHVPSYIASLSELKRLNLTGNRIEYISSDIAKLHNLESLWLGANRMSLLTDSIRDLPMLRELWIDGLPGSEYGAISFYPGEVVVPTHNGRSVIALETHVSLTITTALQYLEEITKAPWIDELYAWADANNIPDLQFVYGELDGLEEAYWVGLPRDRLTLLGLKELDLSWHNLSELPEQLQYLKQLKCLRVQKCRDGLQPPFYQNADGPNALEEIPDWIGEFSKLEELDLENNKITEVPSSVARLTSLRRLNLAHNRIMFVAPQLVNLKNLRVLRLQKNKISVLQDCLKNLSSDVGVPTKLTANNKISALKNAINESAELRLTDEQLVNINTELLELAKQGLKKTMSLTKTTDDDILWDCWQKISDIRSIINRLPNLKELWCDGLCHSLHGPLTLCDAGIEYIEQKELNYDHPIILTRADVELRQLLACPDIKHHLGARIEHLNLWKSVSL